MTSSSANGLNKVSQSAESALTGLYDGATLLVGGFHGHGEPETLLRAVIASGTKGLTVISGGAGAPRSGHSDLHALVESGRVSKLISPLPFDPRNGGAVREKWEKGDLELETLPVGVLTERIRAGGAGIGGFYLPAGANTRFAENAETREIDGRPHLLQTGLKADFALLRASAADTLGNLVYDATQRNWNPVMAMAARVSIAEVDEVREPGELDPELVITPAIFVQRITVSQAEA